MKYLILFKRSISRLLARNGTENIVTRRIILILSTCFMLGCHPPTSQPTNREPVILSFFELRQPIDLQASKPLFSNGKIVLYKNYLLINEPEKGVHIYDNTHPDSPAAIGFLPILGNTDIVVRNDVLLANNYVDLVAFDISDMENVITLYRSEDVFSPPFNSTAYGVDPEEGIIIAFKDKV